jgi:septal ring factor EnvC (AmiA/AmiB activator)
MVKIDKIDTDLLEALKKVDNDLKNITNKVGTTYIRQKELEKLIEDNKLSMERLEGEYITSSNLLNKLLEKIKQKYTSGTINLADGTVTYTAEEDGN